MLEDFVSIPAVLTVYMLSTSCSIIDIHEGAQRLTRHHPTVLVTGRVTMRVQNWKPEG
jgi:hypothetical protein